MITKTVVNFYDGHTRKQGQFNIENKTNQPHSPESKQFFNIMQ